MAAQIRQEINLLDHSISATSSTVDANELAYVDSSQFNGTVTYYLEVVATNSDTSDRAVNLVSWPAGTTGVTVTASTASMTLFRSSALTAPGTAFTTRARLSASATGTLTVKAARLVIIQNATTITNTETQIEIGNYNTGRTAESATILTNPKYWKYDASKWDGSKTFYAEAVYDSGDMDTISVYLYESTAIDAPSWSAKATIVSAATTTTPTRTRVAFTPTDGRWYTIFSLNGSMDNHDIYRAGIVVDQNISAVKDSATGSTSNNFQVQGGTAASGETEQAYGFSFTASSSYSLKQISLGIQKNSSPTDNVYLEILTGSINGTVVGTSDDVLGSSLATIYTFSFFTFTTPVSITSGTTYYVRILRDGARDTTNEYFVKGIASVITGGYYSRDNNTWSSEGTVDIEFRTYADGSITKLEPQYLLANTLFAAGTSLQTFLTKWDSTEWDDGAGSITYYFQAEAANGSTSDVTLEQADGGGTVTNSTLTNIDNAQISAAMTMPASENLDTKATTNAGDVAAARILVTYVYSAAGTAAITGTVTDDSETDIVAGGSTIIITLTGDTWIAAGTGPIGSTANTQALIDGIDSAQSEAAGWDAVVKPGIETTDVVRTSDTVATITLDAEATYNITADETITVTIPAEVLTGAAQIVATPTFTITATVSEILQDIIGGTGFIPYPR